MTLFAPSRRHRPRPADLVVDALAVARLSRLVTTDTFPPIRAARERLLAVFPQEGDVLDAAWYWTMEPGDEGVAYRQMQVAGQRFNVIVRARALPLTEEGAKRAVAVDDHPIGDLITCRWCASVWIAAGALAAGTVPRVWRPLSRLLAFSQVAGALALLEDR